MRRRALAAAVGSTFLAGCSFAPAYEKPVLAVPDQYKELGAWQPAAPGDAGPRGDWWREYQDTRLDELEAQVEQASPDLAAAVDHHAAAQAFAAEARGGLYPQVDAQAWATDNRQSDNRPLRSPSQPTHYHDYAVGAQLTYEFDLWGRVRNQVAAAEASEQASAADLASVRLSLQADVADFYIALRGLDAESKLLSDTIDAYRRALELTQSRFQGGVASGLDVARAQNQLDTARAQATDVRARRALYEHAIARLVGAPASSFTIAPAVIELPLPSVPVSLPSTLLERRPDVAAAERRAAAANAQIGVARAAFFPSIGLSATGGFQDTGSGDLLSAPNLFWSIGPRAFLTLFDAGRRSAREAQAMAAFAETGERYRAIALTAFQQVEDNLALLNLLGEEMQDVDAAVASAQRSLDLALDRYRNGAVNYLEVVVSQTVVLQAQRAALVLRDRRLQASVGLVRALGGGWKGIAAADAVATAASASASSRH
jgi:NodT family efflux transporter outer membrane factor (OMF) lipoprotein